MSSGWKLYSPNYCYKECKQVKTCNFCEISIVHKVKREKRKGKEKKREEKKTKRNKSKTKTRKEKKEERRKERQIKVLS